MCGVAVVITYIVFEYLKYTSLYLFQILENPTFVTICQMPVVMKTLILNVDKLQGIMTNHCNYIKHEETQNEHFE